VQFLPDPHALPQDPQLSLSAEVSMHVPPQTFVPWGQTSQIPAEHIAIAQTSQPWPQCNGSLAELQTPSEQRT
jgi:hypothetical protein